MSKRRVFVRTPWDGQRGFWAAVNRFFYQFEGPAHLGTGEPEAPYVQPTDSACPICRQSMRLHVIDRRGPGEKTFLHCPA